MSRPGKGMEHVDGIDASEEAKRRLRLVLLTMAGELGVEEACAELGISQARFHEIRRTALLGAAGALEPRPPGRPAAPTPDPEVEALRRENRELRRDVEAARIREEIAIVMPHVLRPLRAGEKGGPGEKPGGKRRT